jgi:AcrR family transcriptional regulator
MAMVKRGHSTVQTLPPGRHSLGREQVLASQRARLQSAMVQCVGEYGYRATGLRELARAARVSPNLLGELYEDKQRLFLATYDAIAAVETERVRAAAEAVPASDWQGRLRAAIAAFVEVVIAAPGAARLAIVEIHAVGASALEHQQATLAAHEQLIHEILSAAPHGASYTDTSVKALVAGGRAIVNHGLEHGEADELRGLVEPIHRWALSYHQPLPGLVPEPFTGARTRSASLPRTRAGAANGNSRLLGHRERIMRAVAGLCCEEGYASLRMPAIVARAGVSNQTFYEHFANKHEAFLACYDRVSRRALTSVLASFQAAPSWPEAVRASLATLLEHIAAEPEFARLGLFEVLAAGPDARARAEARTEAFTAMLTPGSPGDVPAGASPRLLGALIAGGAWGVIQRHIIAGRTRRLAELTPALTYMALTPFIGAAEAWRVALGAG